MTTESGRSVILLLAVALAGVFPASIAPAAETAGSWQTVKTNGEPIKRHEAAFVERKGKFYLLGGRGDKPVNIYDPKTNTWSAASHPPIEIHHFQPVVYEDRIWIVGVLTGPFPNEVPIPTILIYDPDSDKWSQGAELPEDRLRGGNGAVVYQGKIYIVAGIVDGHNGDWQDWFDVFDPKTGTWQELPSAPHARDHFQATVIGGKLYAAGGRRTGDKSSGEMFGATVPEVDVYDFATGKWATLDSPALDLPTVRAGSFNTAVGDELIVVGGESGKQETAHSEVEAFNVKTRQWRKLGSLVRGRHGTGVIFSGGKLYVASGCGNRGGSPELTSTESLVWKGQ